MTDFQGNLPGETPNSASTAATPWLATYPRDVDWHAPIDLTPLPQRFVDSVERFADRPCIEFLGKDYTYSEIGALVDRAARGLQDLGVTRGTRVGLYLPNTPYYVVFYHAALRVGATVVNFNPLYARDEVLWQIADSGTRVMVTLDVDVLWSKVAPAIADGRLDHVVLCRMSGVLPFPKNVLFPIVRRRQMAKVQESPRILPFEQLVDNDGVFDPIEIRASDRAVFQYTGGTTGTPKGAVLSHGAIAANTSQVRMLVPKLVEGHESFLGVLPLCHVFAMTVVMNLALTSGARMVLLPRFDLDQVLATIQRLKPTIFPGVPAVYASINESRRVRKHDLTSLKYCISGGAPLPLEVKRRFETLTGCSLVEGYGLSECAPVAACNPLSGDSREGSIGVPVPGVRIEIRDLEQPSRAVGIGERGEVCIQGPNLMDGYWNRPEETASTLRDGWLHTGDVGLMDDDGYVYIVDRIKDVIFRGGYNVYPRVIEEAIYQHPFVAECSVIGVTDQTKGQCPIAFVRLEEGATLTEDALIAFLEDKLSRLELPKRVEFRREPLPRTPIGKPSKKQLLAEYEAQVRQARAERA